MTLQEVKSRDGHYVLHSPKEEPNDDENSKKGGKDESDDEEEEEERGRSRTRSSSRLRGRSAGTSRSEGDDSEESESDESDESESESDESGGESGNQGSESGGGGGLSAKERMKKKAESPKKSEVRRSKRARIIPKRYNPLAEHTGAAQGGHTRPRIPNFPRTWGDSAGNSLLSSLPPPFFI